MTTRRAFRSLPALLLAAALAGCAGRSAADARPLADDPVCLYNRDLGCVHVRVDERTPRASYHGKTYFFCAESCRLAFEKNPQKYLRESAGS